MTSTNARGMTANLGTTPDQNVLSYDGAGNMTSDGENLYLYDAEGRVCAVGAMTMPGQQQPSITGYIYDGDGVRVAKGTIPSTSVAGFSALGCDPSGWTGFQFTADYVLGPGGEQLTQFDGQGKWQRTNVYAGGKLVGTYDLVDNPSYTTGGTALAKIPWLHFHFTDALGTRRMQVSGMLANLGQPEMDFQSLPFGDQLATLTDPYADQTSASTTTGATPLFFTGKERDTESGNDYFGARYYASSMGRWLSPDPSQSYFANPAYPQSLNLYSYVLNNPLVNIDPDGLKCFQVDEDGNFTGTSNAGDCATDSNGNPTNNDVYIDDEQSTNPFMDSNGDLLGYTNGGGNMVGADGNSIPYMGTFNVNGVGTPLNDVDTEISPFAQAFIQNVAKDTASLPWVCNVGVAGRIGREGSRFSLGLDASVAGGFQPTGSINIFDLSGVKGNFTVKGSNQGANLSLPIPTTPFRASINLTSKHPTVGVGPDVRIPKTNVKANAQLYVSFGYLGDASCRGPQK